MVNRLGSETSPYLLQHAANPVDWWPWSDQAWDEARRLDRPVLLSVGYSACHWCHVMAHECFEDDAVAALMNELFVSIKVDREERPDVDAVYMQSVQAMTGQGGWPMTVFCTPKGVPYFGGTYFPPDDRGGMPGFPRVLRGAAEAYRERRAEVDLAGDKLRAAVAPPPLPSDGEIDGAHLARAVERLVDQTDRRHGGFGRAPKFPHPAALDLLLRRSRATGERAPLDAALLSLDRMARGGVYDQVGGGFHRYSVDSHWAVPHFEKMLYDNAQLAPVYLHAWQLTGEARWRAVCEETLDYLLREMRVEGGGFASAQDADAAGVEGSFQVWTPAQLREALDPGDAELAASVFGVTAAGNVEGGGTVLSLPEPLEAVAAARGDAVTLLGARVRRIRERLREARERRPHPGRDDKVITAWNALAVRAFAEAGVALGRADYVAAARETAELLCTELVHDGVVMRSRLGAVSRVRGFLEDSATLADAVLTVHEATGEARWFARARELVDDMLARFADPVGGFYDTPQDGEPLLVRPRTLDDNAVPAGRSTAALVLLRLHALTGEDRLRDAAVQIIAPLGKAIADVPLSLGNLAWALELAVGPVREVAVAGEPTAADTRALVETAWRRWDPRRVLAWGETDAVPLLAGREARGGRATAYVCRGFTCDAPVQTPEELARQLDAP